MINNHPLEQMSPQPLNPEQRSAVEHYIDAYREQFEDLASGKGDCNEDQNRAAFAMIKRAEECLEHQDESKWRWELNRTLRCMMRGFTLTDRDGFILGPYTTRYANQLSVAGFAAKLMRTQPDHEITRQYMDRTRIAHHEFQLERLAVMTRTLADGTRLVTI